MTISNAFITKTFCGTVVMKLWGKSFGIVTSAGRAFIHTVEVLQAHQE